MKAGVKTASAQSLQVPRGIAETSCTDLTNVRPPSPIKNEPRQRRLLGRRNRMPLYRVTKDKLEAVKRTSYAEEKLLERKDLQRLLRSDISAIGDDLMVISEEFGNWEESNLSLIHISE